MMNDVKPAPWCFIALLVAIALPLMAMNGPDPLAACSSVPEAREAEQRCLAAISASEVRGDTRLTAQLLEGLANIYENQERYDDAIATLRRSTELAPGTPHNASKSLARLLEGTGRLEEARDILESLNAQYDAGHRGDAWAKGHIELQLADLYVKLEQRDLAETYYRRSIQHLSRGPGSDPAYPAVSRAIQFFLKEGRPDAAIAVCTRWKESLGVTPKSATKECEQLAAHE
jgi:tetratricopeptide (TPR) repeat protein